MERVLLQHSKNGNMNRTLTGFAILVVFTIALSSCNSNSSQTLLPVKIGSKWGYINPKGQYVINPIYDYAGYHNSGMALVCINGKKGYIDSKGNVALEPEYIDGTIFTENKAFVTIPGSKPLCINKKGNVLFELENCEYACPFSDGMALIVDEEGKAGFVNSDGEMIIKPQYDDADQFSEGLAMVRTESGCGYIDKKGEIVIPTTYTFADSFHNGLAVVKENGKYGFINTKGEMVIPAEFDECEHFSEGLACVLVGDSYGYIDMKGNFAINPQFEEAYSFSNGYATICTITNSDNIGYGCINKKGEISINPQFNYLSNFFEDYAFASDMNTERFGLVNRKGEFIVKPQFEDVNSTAERHIPVRSNYYDASIILDHFFNEYGDNGACGITAKSTLKDVKSICGFREGNIEKIKEREETVFTDVKDEGLNGTRLILIGYEFDRKAYKMVDRYESFWGFTYKSGQKISFTDDAVIKNITYYFKLDGKAEAKEASLAKSIMDCISSKVDKDYAVKENTFSISPAQEHPGYETSFKTDFVTYKILFAE